MKNCCFYNSLPFVIYDILFNFNIAVMALIYETIHSKKCVFIDMLDWLDCLKKNFFISSGKSNTAFTTSV